MFRLPRRSVQKATVGGILPGFMKSSAAVTQNLRMADNRCTAAADQGKVMSDTLAHSQLEGRKRVHDIQGDSHRSEEPDLPDGSLVPMSSGSIVR